MHPNDRTLLVSESIAAAPRVLTVALVGGGKMAQHHARALSRLGPSVRVAGLCDPSDAAQTAMAAIIPGITGYPDLGSLLQRERPDIVQIVTPPATHAALARQALEAGCHIYVEKPFTETSAEAAEILRLAASRQLKVCAGHQLLFEPPARIAHSFLPALGRLVHVESYFSFRTVRRTPDGRTPLRADLQLLDILPHPVYLLLDALDRMPGERSELVSIQVGPAGTVHALVRRGGLTSALTVTLEGRPVESYLRLTGTSGTVHADFVRSTVQRQIGPGTSGIDKLFSPYRIASQLLFGTTRAMARRFLGGTRSYPGLAELFSAFHEAIRNGGPSPVSPENIVGTVTICERVAAELERFQSGIRPIAPGPQPGARVVLTGGTGFLGKAVARRLVTEGHPVTVLARRAPPVWDQIGGVDYEVADLGAPLDPALFRGAETVVHAAAETAGGWDQHQRNSVDATVNVLRAAASAGVRQVIHVSSTAVLTKRGGAPVRDDTPLEPDSKGSGPYVWGKLESERQALALGEELGLSVRVMRPSAIVDYEDFDPPGRLGKRVGNYFVAVGSGRDRLGTVSLEFCARAIAWAVDHFDRAPAGVNLYDPVLPPKRDLVQRLRNQNPDLSVVWLPMLVIHPLSWFALGLQKLLRPGKPAMNVAKIFTVEAVDTSGATRLTAMMAEAPEHAASG